MRLRLPLPQPTGLCGTRRKDVLIVLQLDGETLRKAVRYKRKYREARRDLQLAEVRISELEAEKSGLRDTVEWLQHRLDHPDVEIN